MGWVEPGMGRVEPGMGWVEPRMGRAAPLMGRVEPGMCRVEPGDSHGYSHRGYINSIPGPKSVLIIHKRFG